MIPSRGACLSFILQDNAVVLIFAKAELACKSWPIARKSVRAARLVWSKDPWGGCGSSPWVVPGESEAAACAAESGVFSRPELELLTLSPEDSGELGIGYR